MHKNEGYFSKLVESATHRGLDAGESIKLEYSSETCRLIATSSAMPPLRFPPASLL